MIAYHKNSSKVLQVTKTKNWGCGFEELAINYIYKVPEGYVLTDINHKPLRYFNYLFKVKK